MRAVLALALALLAGVLPSAVRAENRVETRIGFERNTEFRGEAEVDLGRDSRLSFLFSGLGANNEKMVATDAMLGLRWRMGDRERPWGASLRYAGFGGGWANSDSVGAGFGQGFVLGGWHHHVLSPQLRIVSTLDHAILRFSSAFMDEDGLGTIWNEPMPSLTFGSVSVRYGMKDSVFAALGLDFSVGGGTSDASASLGLGTAF